MVVEQETSEKEEEGELIEVLGQGGLSYGLHFTMKARFHMLAVSPLQSQDTEGLRLVKCKFPSAKCADSL